ncbi:uncharacterized protein LOC113848014 isoform X2 [Abrus precatorius]|uniref:Uncharacterized protein LOC113848014 isoform X2 n=1 Tax=Abrus precatorius TaxID=3816 RepID=A0A8B8JNY6_ABRPR|nr:uncharacterized protein LOC113848014 isoform X2 [Abrus precatorius]
MEKRVRLRIQKKKPIKRSGRKLLLKKVFDYLNSDTFMYAPLISSLPSDFLSSNAFPSSAKVVDLKKPSKERQWLREYLKSDVYMYDPLLHLSHSPQEPLAPDRGMMGMDDSTRRLAMQVNQRTGHLGNANQRSESHLPPIDLSDQQTWRHTETVKHTVYQSCRSTSAPSNSFCSIK